MNYHDQLLKMKLADAIFNSIRIIDIESESLCYEHLICDLFLPFEYHQRRDLYEKSISAEKPQYKIEQKNNSLFLFTTLPIYLYEKKFILECITDITARLGSCEFSEENEYMPCNPFILSITDDLTGLYNRRFINKMLPQAINNCSLQKTPLSILFTDLDFFKEINDSHGHQGGDFILNEFAMELHRNISDKPGWVARYGGDEFLICLIGIDNKEAKIVAEDICKNISKTAFFYEGKKIKITCSFGVYTFDNFDCNPSVDLIFREVDRNLYSAKKSGRNKVC